MDYSPYVNFYNYDCVGISWSTWLPRSSWCCCATGMLHDGTWFTITFRHRQRGENLHLGNCSDIYDTLRIFSETQPYFSFCNYKILNFSSFLLKGPNGFPGEPGDAGRPGTAVSINFESFDS